MHGVARILTYACVMALPAVRRSLGRLNCDEAFLGVFYFFIFYFFYVNLQASKVATRGLRLLNFYGDV